MVLALELELEGLLALLLALLDEAEFVLQFMFSINKESIIREDTVKISTLDFIYFKIC